MRWRHALTGWVARQRLRMPRRLPLLLLIILAPVAVIASYSLPLGQVYLVEARTLSATVEISGFNRSWRLPPATLCARHAGGPDPRRAAGWGGQGCNPVLFEETELGTTEFLLPNDALITAQSRPDGGLILRLDRIGAADAAAGGQGDAPAIRLPQGVLWRPGDIIDIAHDAWLGSGALEFSGDVTIGETVGQGADGYLIEGRYEVRERFLRQALWPFGRQAEPLTVTDGTFLRGDRISFRREADGPTDVSLANGFLTPIRDGDTNGFSLVAASDPGQARAEFVVQSFGARETFIRPTWVDRALRDPLLLALTAIGGFAVTVMTLVAEWRKIGRGRAAQGD